MSVVIHGNDCVDAENQGRKVAEVIVTSCKLLILRVCFQDRALLRSGKPTEKFEKLGCIPNLIHMGTQWCRFGENRFDYVFS